MAIQTTIEVLRIPGTLFPRGPFDENASYKFLNFVESGGNGYVCLQPCTGIPVTNTAYWFKFVFKGDKGDAFTYADLTAEQKAELVRDATAAAQAAASSAQSAADDAAAALQKFNTIKAAIDAIDPQSTEGSIQTLAAKQGLLEADLNALGPKIDEAEETLQDEINGRSRFVETKEGLFVIDKQKYIGAKLVDGIFDALGFGSNLTSIITALVESLIGEKDTGLQLVQAAENDGINIVDENGNIVFSLRFYVVEQEGLFFIDNEFNIGVQWQNGKWGTIDQMRPIIDLVPDHNLNDVTAEISGFTLSSSRKDVLEQVYAKMDELVGAYDFCTKVDAAELLGMTYPDYANGVEEAYTYTDSAGVVSTIDVTPAYKTYMYKLEYHKSHVGYGTTIPRKKILILGGVHGNELSAPVNLYLLAKEICEGSDINLFKIFSVFDFYIVPCVNGYGMYHTLRGNARSVNINRNFPVEKWFFYGKDLPISSGSNSYTGPSANSEFETQLIVNLTEYLKPDIAIDHHNYGTSRQQFYSEVPEMSLLYVGYKALADCSYTFMKSLPQYFGTSYNLFKDNSGNASAVPIGIQQDKWGMTSRWWYEAGVKTAATIEISVGINYLDGVTTGTSYDDFGPTAFSVHEYTLRDLLVNYCDFYIKKYFNL